MAFVHIVVAENQDYVALPGAGGVHSGDQMPFLIGNPQQVTKISVIPGAFAAAGSPNARVLAESRLMIINYDTAIEIAIVRKDHSPAAVVPTPLPVPNNGFATYAVILPPYGTDVFVRALA